MPSIKSCITEQTKKGLSKFQARNKCVQKSGQEFVSRPLNRELFTISPFGKEIVIGTPHRVEMVLIFAYAVFFLWWDVLQNKVLDLGIDYRVTWFAGLSSTALDLAIIILILFHVVLMSLFVTSLDIGGKRKDTHHLWDIIIGTLALFGVAIVLSGWLWSIDHETIRFLFVNMKSISFYHIGVSFEMLAGTYWAFTK